ncbi:unnamed protein product [Symbiodinium natans]|uniref:Uncharacterized protein n=1 Tax=Symbiodinium natans TaxID=878477 RepID=A0A812UIV8_9DINO|nr:unnamed protein product [Symbiodinium natans]
MATEVQAVFLQRRLVTLSGSKGIGKTALMVAAGRFIQMRRVNGFEEVYWLNGDVPNKISDNLQDLLRALRQDPNILVLADVPSISLNSLPLRELLEVNQKARLVLEVADASPDQLKAQLGSLNVKPTKMELGPLQPLAQARLFLCRAARPLYDFELHEQGSGKPSTPPKIAEGFGQTLGDLLALAELPWLRSLSGNPSHIVDAAQALKPWEATKAESAPPKGQMVKVRAVRPSGEVDKLKLLDSMTVAEIIDARII